ncbi:807aebc3-e283-421d-ac5e-c75db44f9e86 [Sclerotinia trifoliorum]|uniref:Pre-mRNA-splicing factor n=1 Tax=Sclerotinia trifoliorum TaxID=28548 RepID=A0A8H2VPC0_9HELO|nr:807aebc3-e283-421d-ac5e-c75db44f9e86 [Sclerotinia trifoliorum]
MSPSSDAPKISMKGFSLGATSKTGAPPKSSLGKRPRNSFAHDDEDSEDSEYGTSTRRGKHEAVTGFVDGDVIKEGKREVLQKVESGKEKGKQKTGLDSLTGLDLIIPSVIGNEGGNELAMGEDAYRKAIASAPDVSTLEDYKAVPVEEFGAALLRGMGWDGEERKGGGKEVKRRQNLLGLGAKELKDAEELGAWVQKTDAKRLRPGGSSYSRRGSDRDKKKMGDYARERDERSYRRDRDEGRDRERERDKERDHNRSYRRDKDDYKDRRR